MARPRTFDEEHALDAAMHTFWEKGYDATSTEDLCAATGLGRSSLYNTFGSKHDLFTRALARYIDARTSAQLEVLTDEERSALERMRTVFAMVIDGEFAERRGGRSLGCLVVNSTIELAWRDREVARMLDRDRARRLSGLATALEAGQRNAEVTASTAADELARFVDTVIGGMRVTAQGGADRATLESIAATALHALSP
ncbi:MAG TPA: helix-turn-helix domain-containing protein [Actinopolymorphaceae bacterium]